MLNTISLYDALNKRYLDLEVQLGRFKNEFQALCSLMDRYSYGGFPIIADRGFVSYNVFAHAIENNIDFIIRAKGLNVERLLGRSELPDSIDTTVEIILTGTQVKKKYQHPDKKEQYRYVCKDVSFDYLSLNNIAEEYPLKLRIVRFEIEDGVLKTSLIHFFLSNFHLMQS